jgi:hypothetical protein
MRTSNFRNSFVAGFYAVALSALCFTAASISALPASASDKQIGPIVMHEAKHDVTPLPARFLTSPALSPANRMALEPLPWPGSRMPSRQADTLGQDLEVGGFVNTIPGLNFDGIAHDGFAPPDTNASVGSTQVVETVNVQYAVYDKATGTIVAGYPKSILSLFSGFGGVCQGPNMSDPIVNYDKMANRWLISYIAFDSGFTIFASCHAISKTSDATGLYTRYSINFPSGDLPDYPKVSVWPDAYYQNVNVFGGGGSFFKGANACALNRTAMLAGTSMVAICFQRGTADYSLLPSDLDGATLPPAGSPNYFIELDGTSFTKLDLFKFHVDFAVPANSTFLGPVVIPITSWTQICAATRACITEPAPGEKLDSIGNRLMYRLAYRNFGTFESLVATHTVKPTAGTAVGAVRWYEIRSPGAAPGVFQSGTIQNKKNSFWMPSIAQDKNNDIAVGFSVASGTTKPSIFYTGRVPTDPPGKMEATKGVVKGTGVQLATGNRWGDYSSMAIDPVDDCTFWYAQEYYKTQGSFAWNTRLNSFKFNGCN